MVSSPVAPYYSSTQCLTLFKSQIIDNLHRLQINLTKMYWFYDEYDKLAYKSYQKFVLTFAPGFQERAPRAEE